jgi:ribonuclease III
MEFTQLPAELLREDKRLTDAEKIIGYAFRDRALLLSALTHKSHQNEVKSMVPHNERLEFLGDAVLSLVVADELFVHGENSAEGSMTQRRAQVVSTAALAVVAVSSSLDALLRTGGGVRHGKQLPESIAADVVEAVLAASYLDGGIECARGVVARLLASPLLALKTPPPNPKRDLQERLQRLFNRAPEYVVERIAGPSHQPRFASTVLFRSAVLGRGEGTNKKLATEEAAGAALAALPDTDDALRALLAAP